MVQLIIIKTVAGIETPARFDAEVRLVYGKGFYSKRSNQVSLKTLDGKVHTFDTGVTETLGELTIKGLLPEQKLELETFIIEELNFNEHTFNIRINSADVDIGSGIGNDLLECKFSDTSFDLNGVFQHRAPNIYHCVLPYRFVRL